MNGEHPAAVVIPPRFYRVSLVHNHALCRSHRRTPATALGRQQRYDERMKQELTISRTGWRWRMAAGALGVLSATGMYLWWVLLGPWGYVMPEGYEAPEGPCDQRVFVYGTLRNPLVRWLIVGRRISTAPAAVSGFDKQRLDIQPLPDGRVPGEVFSVAPKELARLDRYERLGVRYERVCLALDSGEPVWVYRRLPV